MLECEHQMAHYELVGNDLMCIAPTLQPNKKELIPEFHDKSFFHAFEHTSLVWYIIRVVHSNIFSTFFILFFILFFSNKWTRNEMKKRPKNSLFWKSITWAVFQDCPIFDIVFSLIFNTWVWNSACRVSAPSQPCPSLATSPHIEYLHAHHSLTLALVVDDG